MRNERFLTIAEQKAQALRCGCRGSDDYCPCQNVADRVTRQYRAAGAVSMVLSSPDARQNAHLIAAAPDLIDALVMALPYVEVCEADPAYKAQHVKNAVKQIRAALAKASPQDNGE